MHPGGFSRIKRITAHFAWAISARRDCGAVPQEAHERILLESDRRSPS